MSGRNFYLLAARIPPKIMFLIVTTMAIAAAMMVQSEYTKKDSLLRQEQLKAGQKEMSSVLVASKDIPENTTITADYLEVKSIETSKVPINALTNTGAALGLKTRTNISAGDCILSQSVKAPEIARGFEAKIKPGHRAITFPVDASTGVAGFLTPDCHVDILAQTGSGAESTAIPILSDVQVVAVGQTYKKVPGIEDAQPTSCVTVSVNPKDAGKLVNAMSAGKLYCLMRNQNDRSPLAVKDISKILPTKQQEYSELSSSLPELPALPVNKVEPPPLPVLKSDDAESRLYNVDTWSANKKDAVSFPQK